MTVIKSANHKLRDSEAFKEFKRISERDYIFHIISAFKMNRLFLTSHRTVLSRLAATSLRISRSTSITFPTRINSGQTSLWTRSITKNTKVDYESKYADALKKKADKQGVTIEELKAKAIKDKESKTTLKNTYAIPAQNKHTTKLTQSTSTNIQSQQKPLSSTSPTLENIMKLDLLLKEDPETIGKIWTEFHADKDCITAVIPTTVYNKLYSRGQKYPMFIIPLPQPSGLEFYLLQFTYHTIIFTSLLEYKTHGENARPYLTLIHYTELKDSKGIVLMKGNVAENSSVLSIKDAQYLSFAVQEFYVTGGERKLGLVETFHERPGEFRHEDVVAEMDHYS